MKILISASIFLLMVFLWSCSDIDKPSYSGPNRTFETSFESESDFDGFYMVPKGDYDSDHELTAEVVYDGTYSHKAWIVKARDDDNDSRKYLPHRAYPTIQLDKTADGIYRTPCLVTLWVNLDIDLVDRPDGSIDDWFSFLTLSPDASDNWNRTVLVNITPDAYVKLVHVPKQGEQERIFQVNAENDPDSLLLFPYREWVRLDVYIDFDKDNGYAKVWQNGELVSHAEVKGGKGGIIVRILVVSNLFQPCPNTLLLCRKS